MKYHNKLFKHLIIFCFSLLTIALFIVFVNANSTLVNESTVKIAVYIVFTIPLTKRIKLSTMCIQTGRLRD